MLVPNISYHEWTHTPLTDAEALAIDTAWRHWADLRRAVNHFELPALQALTFGQVKDAQHIAARGFRWGPYLDWLREAGVSEPEHRKIFDLHRQANWLAEQVSSINAAEQTLVHEPTAAERAAQIDGAADLGPYVQYSELAGGDVLRIDAIRALPYSICFAELKLRHERAEYARRYAEVSRRMAGRTS